MAAARSSTSGVSAPTDVLEALNRVRASSRCHVQCVYYDAGLVSARTSGKPLS